jgi:hypothetical protein
MLPDTVRHPVRRQQEVFEWQVVQQCKRQQSRNAVTDTGYRPLRASVPWKYLGYVAGGAMLIFGLISLAERRMRPEHLFLSFVAALALALLYDLPFEDLLLPPNGDV